MNIAELNSKELATISGGFDLVDFCNMCGGLAGALGAGLMFATDGIEKKIDNYGALSKLNKIKAITKIAVAPDNLRRGGVIVACVMGGNIIGSIVGGIGQKLFGSE
jgi:bacteriocin-like protein